MNVLLHPLLGLVMVALLVLTGQSMAVARGAPGPSGTLTLCTGTGPVTVLVDENGQPTGKPHICPDCGFGLFAATFAAPALPPRPVTYSVKWRPVSHVMRVAMASPRPQARAPPVFS